jgi:hypothetical protein
MVRRRAQRATSRQVASYSAAAKKSAANELRRQINRKLADGIQGAAIQIMNGLAEAGPAWSGEFSASWRFVPEGQSSGGPGPSGSVYQYSKKDIRVTTVERYINIGTERFELINTSEHANIAIDVEESTFVQVGDPVKPNTFTGWRPANPHLRGDLDSAGFGDGTAGTATAPLDWYITYTQGGLPVDLRKGFSANFRGTL